MPGLADIPIVQPLWLNGVLCLVGFGYHAMTKWDEYRDGVAKVSLGDYIKAVPSRVAVSIFASGLAFLGAWAMGWMNPGMAVACGYMANSVINNVADKRGHKDNDNA